MPKKIRSAKITRKTGQFWGWICVIPFGWVFLMTSMIRRKNDVIKYRALEAGVALDVLRNYIHSFISLCIFVIVMCLMSFIWSKNYYVFPSISYIVSIIIIPITYHIVTNKILDFEEKKQTKKHQTTYKVKHIDASNESTEDYCDGML